jgi:phytoene synthase
MTIASDPVPNLSAAVMTRMPSWLPPLRASRKWHRDRALRESLRACAEVTREHAKSFHFCSHVLPAYKRAAAFAVYAFCRYVDDRVDRRPPGAVEAGRFEAELRQDLEDIEAGRSRLPFAPAFAAAATEFGIDREWCLELIRGCCRDEAAVRMLNFEELELYCYQVASTVGLMMSRIFGLENPEGVRRAVELGIALQLTNILRDVDADYKLGRVYLPANELAEAGVTERDIAQRNCNDAWRQLMRRQIMRARTYYRSSEVGLVFLDNDGSRFATRLISRIYGGILTEIERLDYDVFSERAYVSTARKLWITGLTILE